ncbi:MAG: CDP-diacylglycerol-inositol 3-phosphatidyltransferase [Cyphobasidiales sp. Tagirdzhanova-0007]|nr:MAG: CDP-diacylglycerol-inositol 3-phosphatidyltransferase [Cyphobasidiales sp. Tagirdzhanova-0007]
MEAQAAAMGHTDIDMDEERPKTDENVFLFVPVSPAMARPASDSLRSFSWKRLTTSRNHPRRCAESDRQVWIGYLRVILAAVSLIYMSYHPKMCTVLYGISSLLDAVDGQAARALGQSSRWGANLDMITDR